MRFDGQDDSLTVDYCKGLLYSYYNSTLLAVVQTKTGGTIISHAHTTLAVHANNGGMLTYSAAYEDFHGDGKHTWPAVRTLKKGAVPLGDPAILTMRRHSGGKGGTSLFINGHRDDDRTAIAYHASNASHGYIGVGYTGKRQFWRGDLAEIILYGRALSEPERQSVLRYLRRKYRIEE